MGRGCEGSGVSAVRDEHRHDERQARAERDRARQPRLPARLEQLGRTLRGVDMPPEAVDETLRRVGTVLARASTPIQFRSRRPVYALAAAAVALLVVCAVLRHGGEADGESRRPDEGAGGGRAAETASSSGGLDTEIDRLSVSLQRRTAVLRRRLEPRRRRAAVVRGVSRLRARIEVLAAAVESDLGALGETRPATPRPAAPRDGETPNKKGEKDDTNAQVDGNPLRLCGLGDGALSGDDRCGGRA